jgi:FkbM family methyltransferase
LEDNWLYDYRIKQGDTVVDIGAGIGDDAVFFSRLVGLTGRVVAVEANPRTFRCLEKTVKANGLSNVTAVHVALSDSVGDIFIDDSSQHAHNRIRAEGLEGSVKVKATTLDNLLLELCICGPQFI